MSLRLPADRPVRRVLLWAAAGAPPEVGEGAAADVDAVLPVRLEDGRVPDPADPEDLLAAQRAHRALARALTLHGNRTGDDPELRVVGGEDPALAADLGFRLGGRRVEGCTPEAGAGPLPSDPAAALAWGHARAARPGDLAIDTPAGPLVLRGSDVRRSAEVASAREALEAARAAPGLEEALAALDAVPAVGTFPREAAFLRAERLRAAGRAGEAAQVLQAVARAHADDVMALVRACRELLALRRAQAALDVAVHATRVDPAAPVAWLARADVEAFLLRHRDAMASLEAAARLRPADAEPWVRLARRALAAKDAELALDHACAGLAHGDEARLLALRAEAASRLAHPEAVPWALAALAADAEAWGAVAGWLAGVGAVDEARRVLDGRSGPLASALSAHLHLWAGDLDAACAEPVPRGWRDHGLVVGAVAVLQGRPTEALDPLTAALEARDGSPLAEPDVLLTWRSEARRALGEPALARQDAAAAMSGGDGYSPSAHLARALAVLAAAHPDDHVDPYAWQAIAAQAVPLVGPVEDGPAGTVRARLEAVLPLLGGNRSRTWTVARDGRLERQPLPPHVRTLGRLAQLRLRTRPVDEVVAWHDTLVARFPDEAVARTYAGETLLWLGRLDAAEARFDEAIALRHATTWAWIGKGACHLLRGGLDEAQAIWAQGVVAADFTGPTLRVYRGEAAWRAGDLAAATADLDTALADKPHRLSAWVLRALVAADAGQGEPAVVVSRTLAKVCPGLWRDAVTHARVGPDDPRKDEAVLRAVLALCRGNRSSSVVTYVVGDALRFAAWGRFLAADQVFGRG
ncbi:MAG: hypothetical protein H6732_12875 [Alphaproteobacteria bacterium]|nr:hypothetical protein [Alphaproteobacteria bacterium]